MLTLSVNSHARVGIWQNNKTFWQSIIDVNPRSVEAYLALGAEYMKEDDYARAIPLFRKAGSISPKSLSYELGMASICYIRGDLDAAMEILQKGLIINPASARAHILMGDIYSKTENYDKALEHYSRVLVSGQDAHHLIPGTRAKIARINSLRTSK